MGYLWAIISALLFSFSGPLIKSCPLDQMTISTGRALAAFVVFAMIAAIERQPLHYCALSRRSLIVGSISGVISNVTFVVSLYYIPVGVTVAVLYGSLLTTPWLERWVHGTPLSRADYIGVLIVLLGIVVLLLDSSGEGNLTGVLFAFIAGVSFGGAMIGQKASGEHEREFQLVLYLLTVLVGIPSLLLYWDPRILDISVSWPIAVNGLVHAMVFLSIALALRTLKAKEVSFISNLEILFAPVIAYFMVNEVPTGSTVIAGLIILVGVVYHSRSDFLSSTV